MKFGEIRIEATGWEQNLLALLMLVHAVLPALIGAACGWNVEIKITERK